MPTVTEVEDGWLSYTHQKFLDLPDWEIPWKGLTMYYPPTWKLSEDRVATTPSLNLKITKTNGDYLEIIQAAGGGGYCLFPTKLNMPLSMEWLLNIQNTLKLTKAMV